MDTNTRILVKALCWQALGLVTLSLIGYLFTGSFGEGGALALVTGAVSLVSYVLYEKLWSRITWGRLP